MALGRSSTLPRVAAVSAQNISKRNYVSESKKDNAQVSVETAIRGDQKKFFAETGKNAEGQPMMGSSANADAMMSPMAGKMTLFKYIILAHHTDQCRCSQASHCYGRG